MVVFFICGNEWKTSRGVSTWRRMYMLSKDDARRTVDGYYESD